MKNENAWYVISNLIEILLNVSLTFVDSDSCSQVDFKGMTPPPFIMDRIRIPVFHDIFKTMISGMVYHVIDRFKIQYSVIFDEKEGGYFIIGPYRTQGFDTEDSSKILSENGLDTDGYGNLLDWYYSLLPAVDVSKIQPCMTTIAEYRFPGSKILYKRIIDNPEAPPTMVPPYTASHSNEIMMEYLEEKYRLENMVLKAIEKGNRTEAMLAYKDFLHFEKTSGIYRNQHLMRIKSNSHSMNALYRKAAEKGGVHPFYLDQMSQKFFNEINQVSALDSLKEMDYNMMICYCDLVHKMSLRNHSPIIRQGINYIRINISGDLKLANVAEAVNVSPNYFSGLFNQEMGITLSEYVHQVRIEEAVRLFETGMTSIKEVAYQSGFENVNYFSRIFRKEKGMLPSEYRRLCQAGR